MSAADDAAGFNDAGNRLFAEGRFVESIPYYERALDLAMSSGRNPEQCAVILANLANAYVELGSPKRAEELQLARLDLLQGSFPDGHGLIQEAVIDLGRIEESSGELRRAEMRYRRVLAVVGTELAHLAPYVSRIETETEDALRRGDLADARATLSGAVEVLLTHVNQRQDFRSRSGLVRLEMEAGLLDRSERNLKMLLYELTVDPGSSRVDLAATWRDLGWISASRKNPAEARDRYQKAMDALGSGGPAWLRADLLLGLARVAVDEGERSRLLDRALDAVEGLAEQDDALRAEVLHAVGRQRAGSGDLEEGRDALQEALHLRAPNDLSSGLADRIALARLSLDAGRLDDAAGYLAETDLPAESLAIHPHLAVARDRLLGEIASAANDLTTAESRLRRALQGLSFAGIEDDGLGAGIHRELGLVLVKRGQRAAARRHFENAAATLSRLPQEYNDGLGRAYWMLGSIDFAENDFAAAASNTKAALELLEQVHGPAEPSLGGLWHQAAVINMSLGARETARTQLARARQLLGDLDAGATARVVADQAKLEYLEGNWEAARSEAAAIRVKLPDDDPTALWAALWEGRALAALSRQEDALEVLLRRWRMVVVRLRRNAGGAASSDRAAAIRDARAALNDVLTLAVDTAGAGWAARAYDLVQLVKGAEAEIFSRGRRQAAATDRDAWRRLADLESLAGRILLHRPGEPLTEDDEEQLADLAGEIEKAERAVLRVRGPGDPDDRYPVVTWSDIATRLEPGQLLIEYVRFELLDFRSISVDPTRPSTSGRYCAFAVSSSASGEDAVRLVDLGSAATIDNAGQQLRAAVERRREPAELGLALRRLVLDPVLVGTEEPATIVVAPDGSLGTVPFDVLRLEDGRWLADAYSWFAVDVGRDLVKPASGGEPGPSVVVAAPDFDLRDEASPGSDSGRLAWEPLPGTAREGSAVAARLGVEPLLGRDALESAVRRAASPLVLHLATHGYFLPEPPDRERPDVFETVSIVEVPGAGMFLAGVERRQPDEETTIIHASRLDNPLLRSGVVLAGANTWLSGGVLPLGAEDGVLTALDVAQLDLAETQLVVLSACETGLGVPEAGEGLLGLRRSFRLAGAQTVVASLWKVADEATAELMNLYYRRILDGESRASALQMAKRDLRELGYEHPFYWAAFVSVGAPGSLEGGALSDAG